MTDHWRAGKNGAGYDIRTQVQLIALARERGIYPPENATDEELKGVERK